MARSRPWRLPLGLALLLTLLQSGCNGDDSSCGRICTWIASCYSSAGMTAPPCPLSNACGPNDWCRIDCYDSSTCEAVTKKNTNGYHQLQSCLDKCGWEPDLGPKQDKSSSPEVVVILPEGSPSPEFSVLIDMPVSDDISSALLPFGSVCTYSSECASGLECVGIQGSTTGKGFCTKTCTFGTQCSGAPGGTYAACILSDGTKYTCGFLCYVYPDTYPCPSSAMSCMDALYSEAGMTTVKLCIP